MRSELVFKGNQQVFCYLQTSQDNSRLEISSDCVVFGNRFYRAKSAANDNTIRGNLKMGVILRGLVISPLRGGKSKMLGPKTCKRHLMLDPGVYLE